MNNSAEIASVEMYMLPVMHAANRLITLEAANTLATVVGGSLRPGLHHVHGGNLPYTRPTSDSQGVSPGRGGLLSEMLSAVMFHPT